MTRLLEKTCRDQEKVIEQLELMVREGAPRHAPSTSQLALPAPIAVPKLEPREPTEPDQPAGDLPNESNMRLKIRELENKLKFSEEAHQEELADVMATKMDLQLQLARFRR